MSVGALSLSIILMAFSGISSSRYAVSMSLFHCLTEALAVFPLAAWQIWCSLPVVFEKKTKKKKKHLWLKHMMNISLTGIQLHGICRRNRKILMVELRLREHITNSQLSNWHAFGVDCMVHISNIQEC